jgi:hypothetical protein
VVTKVSRVGAHLPFVDADIGTEGAPAFANLLMTPPAEGCARGASLSLGGIQPAAGHRPRWSARGLHRGLTAPNPK